jgi:hypothetical protein
VIDASIEHETQFARHATAKRDYFFTNDEMTAKARRTLASTSCTVPSDNPTRLPSGLPPVKLHRLRLIGRSTSIAAMPHWPLDKHRGYETLTTRQG